MVAANLDKESRIISRTEFERKLITTRDEVVKHFIQLWYNKRLFTSFKNIDQALQTNTCLKNAEQKSKQQMAYTTYQT